MGRPLTTRSSSGFFAIHGWSKLALICLGWIALILVSVWKLSGPDRLLIGSLAGVPLLLTLLLSDKTPRHDPAELIGERPPQGQADPSPSFSSSGRVHDAKWTFRRAPGDRFGP